MYKRQLHSSRGHQKHWDEIRSTNLCYSNLPEQMFPLTKYWSIFSCNSVLETHLQKRRCTWHKGSYSRMGKKSTKVLIHWSTGNESSIWYVSGTICYPINYNTPFPIIYFYHIFHINEIWGFKKLFSHNSDLFAGNANEPFKTTTKGFKLDPAFQHLFERLIFGSVEKLLFTTHLYWFNRVLPLFLCWQQLLLLGTTFLLL